MKFTREFAEDLAILASAIGMPSDAIYRIRSEVAPVTSPIDGSTHMRPVIEVTSDSGTGDDDLVHNVRIEGGSSIRFVFTEKDARRFADLPGGLVLYGDPALMQAFKEAMTSWKRLGKEGR